MSLNLLAAKAVLATNGLTTARTLASFGDDAVKLVATQLDDVARTLGTMTGRDAQVFIGARVNFAQQAQQRVGTLARTAERGTMPAMSSFDDALRSVRQLGSTLPKPSALA